MRVLLVGLPGAGATTVGGLLSKRLGWPFLDDAALLERTGSPTRALTLLLGMPGQLVATVPGSVIDDPLDRERLVGPGTHVGDNPTVELRRLYAGRRGLYESIANQVVDTDAMPAGQVANLVIEAVAG